MIALALMLAVSANAVSLGKQLYAVHCVSCHGANLQGGVRAPALVDVDAAMVDFQLQTGRMPTQGPYEEEFHKQAQFPPDQIAAIEAYISSRSSGSKTIPNPSPPASPPPQMLVHGRELYEENCEHCHSATGRGDGATAYGNAAPSLMMSDAREIAEAVREGPDVMPPFGARVLSDNDVRDISAYVHYLQTAQYNPGGLQLANWGPVSEGFIAWVVGLAVLVLFIRRIGEG